MAQNSHLQECTKLLMGGQDSRNMERADITEQLIRQRVLALVYYIGTLQTQK